MSNDKRSVYKKILLFKNIKPTYIINTVYMTYNIYVHIQHFHCFIITTIYVLPNSISINNFIN